MSLTELLVPTYKHMLRTLAGLLDQSQRQMPEEKTQALLSARLASDMYPLSSQLRFAVFQAQEAVFRLRGEPLPHWLEAIAGEGRNAGDAPGSIADAKARIDEALAFLDALAVDALDGGIERPITLELPNGVVFDMTGEQYARDWALAQFYFHVITAYAILRNQGLQIGKADYVPHMLAYIRGGSLPHS